MSELRNRLFGGGAANTSASKSLSHGAPTSSLTITLEQPDGALVVIPKGDIDLAGSPTLRQELKKFQTLKPAPSRMIIDLSGVPYMDSSGVATLVEAMQIARKASTKLVLCGLQDKVRSIFEIARLDTVFAIAADRPSAMTL